MNIKCPDCGHEYDIEKECRLSLNRFTGRNVVKAAIRCGCGSPLDATLTKPFIRSWLFLKKFGGLNVEVKKRAESAA